MKCFIRCILLLIISSPSLAQEKIQVRGHFEADTISVGGVVPYSLTARYFRKQQVLFPDSTYSFKPFEISRKEFYPTRSTETTSYDSVVYWLTTFEIDSIQTLALPVYLIHEKDCVVMAPQPDSIHLRFRVSAMPDSVTVDKLPLKSNTKYLAVRWLLNYPVISIIIFILLVVVVASWIIFGKRVRRYFALKRLTRQHQEFLSRFKSAMQSLTTSFNSRKAEETLLIWKDYLEDLEKHPYTKMTSREISRLIDNPDLVNSLRSIDRSIYGGQLAANLDPFNLLLSYSGERFHQKEEELKNG